MTATRYDQQIDEHMRRLVDDYLADTPGGVTKRVSLADLKTWISE